MVRSKVNGRKFTRRCYYTNVRSSVRRSVRKPVRKTTRHRICRKLTNSRTKKVYTHCYYSHGSSSTTTHSVKRSTSYKNVRKVAGYRTQRAQCLHFVFSKTRKALRQPVRRIPIYSNSTVAVRKSSVVRHTTKGSIRTCYLYNIFKGGRRTCKAYRSVTRSQLSSRRCIRYAPATYFSRTVRSGSRVYRRAVLTRARRLRSVRRSVNKANRKAKRRVNKTNRKTKRTVNKTNRKTTRRVNKANRRSGAPKRAVRKTNKANRKTKRVVNRSNRRVVRRTNRSNRLNLSRRRVRRRLRLRKSDKSATTVVEREISDLVKAWRIHKNKLNKHDKALINKCF